MGSLGGTFWVTWLAQPMAGLGGHILGRLGSATYGQAQGTHFGPPWRRNLLLVSGGHMATQLGWCNLWPVSGDTLSGTNYCQSQGTRLGIFWAPCLVQPMASLRRHLGCLGSATYGQFRLASGDTFWVAWPAQPTWPAAHVYAWRARLCWDIAAGTPSQSTLLPLMRRQSSCRRRLPFKKDFILGRCQSAKAARNLIPYRP